MQKKKAISLIVLVITIIVMIILAGSIILTLSNNGIINKASDAVEKSDEATVNQIAQMAWADAYADYIKGELSEDDFSGEVIERIETALDSKADMEDYGIIVTKKGVEIVKGWIQDGLVVKKGKTTLKVGDDIVYDDLVDSYNAGWKILGANKRGELLIVSSEVVEERYLLNGSYYEFYNEIEGIEDFCKEYGKGKSATGARSINTEDIDRIIQRDKTLYGKGNINEYGNVVTYSYDGSKIQYTSTNGSKGELEVPEKGFYYNIGMNLVKADLSKGPCEITKTTNNTYLYTQEDFNHIKGKNAYSMLKGNYWLVTRCVEAKDNGISYGLQEFRSGEDEYETWFWQYGDSWRGYEHLAYETGVRPVVSLSQSVKLTGASSTGWTY